MYNLDFNENPLHALSLVFQSKIVILFLTRSKRIDTLQSSTPDFWLGVILFLIRSMPIECLTCFDLCRHISGRKLWLYKPP